MAPMTEDLRDAYEAAGYDVGEVTRNRNLLRVVVLGDDPGDEELEGVARAELGEDEVMGVLVATESVDAHDDLATVVSVRLRP